MTFNYNQILLLIPTLSFATVTGIPPCDRVSLPNDIASLPMYPEINSIETQSNGNINIYISSQWPSERNPIVQQSKDFQPRVSSELFYYRAVIDSIEEVSNCYPILHARVDSSFLGPTDYLGKLFKIEPTGTRPIDKFPNNYWLKYKNVSFVTGVYREFAHLENQWNGYFTTDVYGLDNFEYLSNGDTLRNDGLAYGKFVLFGPMIDSLKATTPVIENHLNTILTAVRIFELNGKKVWQSNSPDHSWKRTLILPLGIYRVEETGNFGSKVTHQILGD